MHRRPANILERNISRLHSILNMLNLTLLFGTASQTRPDRIGIFWNGGKIVLGSTDLEGSLSSLKVASVVLRADEGEDDNVSGNDTDEDTLDEGVVWHNRGTGGSLNRSFVAVTGGWRKEE